MRKAEIITIGDELLYGSITDTNAAYLGQRLTELGIEPCWATSVGDDRERIEHALEHAVFRADVVLVTGGLGPTHDDITKDAIARVASRRLVFHPEILDRIQAMFDRRGIPMPESNRVQAFVPEGAEVLDNPIGTAPGFMLQHERATVFVMPGVPGEMTKMMAEQVTPRLADRAGGRIILHRMLKSCGVGESTLFEHIGDLIASATDVRVASLPQTTGVNLRLTVHAATREEAQTRIAALETRILERAGRFFYGADEETLEEVVGRMLKERGMTIAVAESCTGGLIADMLTNVPGSSAYFERGIVAYSNKAKTQHIEVPEAFIRTHGAVSAETAGAMAEGIRRISRTTLGLSTTGIAGPTGGTPEKPVGLVYIGLAHPDGVVTRQLRLGTERRSNKVRSAQAALNLVRLFLIDPALMAPV